MLRIGSLVLLLIGTTVLDFARFGDSSENHVTKKQGALNLFLGEEKRIKASV